MDVLGCERPSEVCLPDVLRNIFAASLAICLVICSVDAQTSRPSPRSDLMVTMQPPTSDPLVADYLLDPSDAPPPSNESMARLLRQKIKYVFVIFNENESFDHEYGTFPGANGLYSDGVAPRAPDRTPGFVQDYVDSAGARHRVAPFRLGPGQNATFMDSVDHTHTGLAAKLAVHNGTPHMTGFAQVEYDGKTRGNVTAATDARGKQFASLVMSYIDCDTIPFFWLYANRFVLFDSIFATEDTPSTPNAVALIAGQAGETQWVRQVTAGMMPPTLNAVPLVRDPVPFWGSPFDVTVDLRQPTSPKELYTAPNVAPNLTFATVLLTAAGTHVGAMLSGDRHPATNQADILRDIPAIAAYGTGPVAWGWYQNGYDFEPTDTNGIASHANYVAHHQGPQYFGYLADNAKEVSNLHGEGDFFDDVAKGRLPANGGVFYIRGGFGNLQKLRPPIQNPNWPPQAAASGGLTLIDIATIQASKQGDDDHPTYADHAISEAMNARVINAIAGRPELWARSAIIITYDESDGFYDHVPPRILSYGPDTLPLSRGIRVPLLVISPYARTHVVSHVEGDHNAVIETINAIFHLPALSTLPDEADALAKGNAPDFNRFGPTGFEQHYLGPRDTNAPITDSLLSAFDPRRLSGAAPPLPPSYAMIDESLVTSLPHFGTAGCASIGIVPEDRRQGVSGRPPPNFNSLPATLTKYNVPAPP